MLYDTVAYYTVPIFYMCYQVIHTMYLCVLHCQFEILFIFYFYVLFAKNDCEMSPAKPAKAKVAFHFKLMDPAGTFLLENHVSLHNNSFLINKALFVIKLVLRYQIGNEIFS